MDNFGLGDVILSIFWFMLLFAWIWLLIVIFSDIFRDHSLSGGGKALWVLLIIIFPWLGALIYLIARGKSMNERSIAAAQANEKAFRSYVQDAAATGGGGASVADELAKLSELKTKGVLSDADYEAAKAKVLAG